jgi:hypothetical protein
VPLSPTWTFLLLAAAIAIVIPGLRTVRLLVFLGMCALIDLVGTRLPDWQRMLLQLSTLVAISLVIVFADWIGVGSMTRSEAALSRRIERARRTARATDTPAAAVTAATELSDALRDSKGVPVEWSAAIRMLRRTYVRPYEPSGLGTSPTPTRSFMIAAARYLADLRQRRTIWHEQTVGAKEEDIALRAYLDDFRVARLHASSDPAALSEATGVLDELKALPIHDPQVASVRSMLLALLRRELDDSIENRGETTTTARLADDVMAAWHSLETRFRLAPGPWN